MTKEDLMPLAKTYFDSDKLRTKIFGTEDKHFFNSEGDAKSYCKAEKKYFYFTKHDFEKEKLEEAVIIEEVKEEVKEEPKKVNKPIVKSQKPRSKQNKNKSKK